MKTSVQYAGNDYFIGVSPGGHAHVFDTNGDRKSAPTPVEMLLSAIGACTGADVVSILAKKRQKVTGYRNEVSGQRRQSIPAAFSRFTFITSCADMESRKPRLPRPSNCRTRNTAALLRACGQRRK